MIYILGWPGVDPSRSRVGMRLLRRGPAVAIPKKTPSAARIWPGVGWIERGAGHEIRTRDFNLGKVALYH